MYRRLLFVLTSLALGGCGLLFDFPAESKLPGERISVLRFDRALQPDSELARLPVRLPPPWANPGWPQAGGLASHAMHHLELGDAPSRAWRTSVGRGSNSERRLLAQPVVAGNRVYTLDASARVYALEAASGKRVWRKDLRPRNETEGTLGGGIAFAYGRLYVTTGFAEVLALNADTGTVLWRRGVSGPMRAAPTVAEGRVFAVTIDNKTYALAADDGRVLWTHTGMAEIAGLLGGASPAVADGIVVVPYSSGELYALSATNGRQLWTDFLARPQRTSAVSTMADIQAAPVIDRGRVIGISNSGSMVAIGLRSGARLWEQRISGQQSPWVAGEFIYVMATNGDLVCLTRRDGRVRWVSVVPIYENEKKKTGLISWAGPVLAGDRLLLAGSHGEVLSISPYTGDLLSVIKMPDAVIIPPAVANKTLYFLTDDADLIALR
ncbi:MAG: PQQ-binding-like beta-propeller repeat protein [Alphaproteobacteria bacterium]